jgi:hypothetical protein
MAFRNVKQSLQDLAELKEAEQKEKQQQQKELAELEEIKKDINTIIDDELYNIEKDGNDNLLLYYYKNKIDITMDVYKKLLNSHLIIVKNKEAERHEKLKAPLDGYFIDDNGHLTPIYSQVSKYNADRYNADKMQLLINELLKERLGTEEKEAKTIEKLEQKEQKETAKELKNIILNNMIIAYKHEKQENKTNAFDFYDLSNTEQLRAVYFDALSIKETPATIEAYNGALKQFKNYYCLGTRPKEQKQKQKKGVGIIGGALAVFLGICEGIEKGK